MTRYGAALNGLTSALLAVATVAAVGISSHTASAAPQPGIPADLPAKHAEPMPVALPGHCTRTLPETVIPSAVVVVPAHHYATPQTMTLDRAHALVTNSSDIDDVYVVGACR